MKGETNYQLTPRQIKINYVLSISKDVPIRRMRDKWDVLCFPSRSYSVVIQCTLEKASEDQYELQKTYNIRELSLLMSVLVMPSWNNCLGDLLMSLATFVTDYTKSQWPLILVRLHPQLLVKMAFERLPSKRKWNFLRKQSFRIGLAVFGARSPVSGTIKLAAGFWSFIYVLVDIEPFRVYWNGSKFNIVGLHKWFPKMWYKLVML